MSFGAEVFLAVAMLVGWRTTSSFFPQHSDWEPCPQKIRKVKLIDGSWDRHGLMRRKVNGRWEYRKMTTHEAAQAMDINITGGFFVLRF
jgi:hypothetical protein